MEKFEKKLWSDIIIAIGYLVVGVIIRVVFIFTGFLGDKKAGYILLDGFVVLLLGVILFTTINTKTMKDNQRLEDTYI